jgi:squalene-associated FAD-dependent desaturase
VSTRAPVIVVGGGAAGLAAAVRLAGRDIPVILLEQRPRAGGRTYSFRDTVSGENIDNGQHLLLAGYRHTLAFLTTIGARALLDVQSRPALVFHHPDRGIHRLELPDLPAPFHLITALLRFGLFGPADRLRLLRAGTTLRSPAARFAGRTVGEWLTSAGQSAETRRSFWDPLTIAVMNELPERAAAVPFLRALQTAFLGSADGAALAVPAVGLSELLVDPAVGYLAAHGARVQYGADVVRVLLSGGRVAGVQVRDGGTVEGSAVILAVPWHAAGALLEESVPLSGGWNTIAASPIVSVHLWFPEDFMPEASVGLIGRRVHWVFNRRKICREAFPGGHLSVVISAAGELVDWTNEALIAQAVADIRSVYSRCPVQATRGVVIREKRATPSLTPAVEAMRPGSVTAVANLFLAGDWTDTGLPATIEGAVLSGERCAALAAGDA